MKRFIPLALVVLAIAAVPAAFADGGTPAPTTPATTTTTTTAAPAPATAPQAKGHPFARMRLEILRLRIQMLHLRYRIACHDVQSDTCTQFTQDAVSRLTALDQKVQAKESSLGCSTGSADRRCDILSKVDAKLQQVIAKLGSPSAAAASSTGDESGLDAAANQLGQLSGSNG